jgi:CheY-like chemotaxis protein
MSQEAKDPLTVLLVDDSEAFLEAAGSWIATQRWLRLAGTARDGAEALARLEQEKVSLVLMDAFMPVLDGFEATRRIKAADESPIVIMLSVAEQTVVRHEAWAAGADAFLPKSEFSDRLPGLIREVLADEPGPAGPEPASRAGDRRISDDLNSSIFQTPRPRGRRDADRE